MLRLKRPARDQLTEQTMLSRTHRHVVAIAVVSLLSVVLASADALAKSKHRNATAARSAVNSAVVSGPSRYSYAMSHGGGVHSNTAGWGNVGAP
jgi:hypothetical protein